MSETQVITDVPAPSKLKTFFTLKTIAIASSVALAAVGTAIVLSDIYEKLDARGTAPTLPWIDTDTPEITS